jgi:DNA mismatch repair protein MutS
MIALRASLEAIPALRKALTATARPASRRQALAAALDDGRAVVDLIRQAIVPDPPATLVDGGVIAAGFSADLDDLRASTEHARRWIESLEAVERERTGIRSLRVGYNRVFGYYLEVSNANRDLIPASYVRKQTLVGAERYVTPELKEYEAIVLNAKERIVESEQALFRQICGQIAADRDRVLRTARAVATVDVLAALAEVAVQNQYVRPELDDGPTIEIRGGRHPVVEEARSDAPFTPNDVCLSTEDAQILILTGPNMAGKSTFLRQVALIVLLAQIGSFVPADHARVGLVDRIFTRVGAQDDLSAGQSTFLVEMLETAHLLTHGTMRSLLILDEVGRGTSTYDGLAIAQAIVEYIHNHPRLGARTLFATHYHELTDLTGVLPRVRNFRMDVREEGGEVHFLHRVVPGAADRSYGVHVARLAGIPRAVTRRAEEILRELERRQQRPSGRRREEPRVEVIQLSLLAEPNPAVEDLKSLDVLSLTPIEAIQKLFELQQKAKETG